MDERTTTRVNDPSRLAAVKATGLLDTPQDEAFDRLARLAGTILGTPFAFVTLVDDRRSFWKSCIGVDATDPAERQNLVEESFCQYVISSGEELIVGDAANHPVTMHNPSIASMGVAAWAGFPITSGSGEIIGTFCVVDTVLRDWSEQDIDVLRALSAAASGELALRESVALAESASVARERANARLSLLADASAVFTETLEVEVAVGRLAELVVPMLGDWCIVSVTERDGSLRDVAASHVDAALQPIATQFAASRLEGIANQGATYAATRSSQPVLVTSRALASGLEVLQSDDAKALYRRLAPESFGVFPLTARDHVNGTITIVRGADRPPMSPEDRDVAESIAGRAGLALDNANLFVEQKWISEQLRKTTDRLRKAGSHDRIVSRALQDAMLTQLPTPDNITLGAHYRTASGTDQVGGDWYDATTTSGGNTTLVVGDVAGHDITAAGIMGQLRNMTRAFAWDRDEAPADSISRLDRAMRDLEITTMTTMAVVQIELAVTDGPTTMRWAIAGHPPPVLIPASMPSAYLTGAVGPPLAVDADVARSDGTCEIDPGDTLLLYTDGLIETRDEDIDARQARLLEVVDRNRHLEPSELIDAVVHEMVGDHPADDVAVLAARLTAAS